MFRSVRKVGMFAFRTYPKCPHELRALSFLK